MMRAAAAPDRAQGSVGNRHGRRQRVAGKGRSTVPGLLVAVVVIAAGAVLCSVAPWVFGPSSIERLRAQVASVEASLTHRHQRLARERAELAQLRELVPSWWHLKEEAKRQRRDPMPGEGRGDGRAKKLRGGGGGGAGRGGEGDAGEPQRLLYISIGTKAANAGLRKALRATWLRWARQEQGRVRYRFFTDLRDGMSDAEIAGPCRRRSRASRRAGAWAWSGYGGVGHA